MSPRHVPATQAELSRIGLLAELPGEQLFAAGEADAAGGDRGGQAPIIEGEEGDRFYVVLNGVFAVSNLGSMPRRMLRPGDYFGEVALAMDVPRTANVRALTPATVASCDKATFDEFLRPLFADDDARQVRKQLAHGRGELEAVAAACRADDVPAVPLADEPLVLDVRVDARLRAEAESRRPAAGGARPTP